MLFHRDGGEVFLFSRFVSVLFRSARFPEFREFSISGYFPSARSDVHPAQNWIGSPGRAMPVHTCATQTWYSGVSVASLRQARPPVRRS